MMLTLRAPEFRDAESTYAWRIGCREGLRTSRVQTLGEQEAFIRNLPNSPDRWWSVEETGHRVLVAFAGLIHIEWENGVAEISLITDPQQRRHGIGSQVVELVLEEAFARMRLETVIGEVYLNNPAVSFWKKIAGRYQAYQTTLPRRKCWDGKLYDALYFSISRPHWAEVRKGAA